MFKIVEFSHLLIKEYITNSNLNFIRCLDATCGNGFDTLYMASLLNDKGCVDGYDIQKIAIDNTSKLLSEKKITNVTLYCKSHDLINPTLYDLAIFNLGYLPGYDKTIKTNKETTLNALKNLIPRMNKNKMLIIICLYIGHKEGLEESIEIDKFLKELPSNKYLVCKYQNYNRPTSPYILTLSYNKQK